MDTLAPFAALADLDPWVGGTVAVSLGLLVGLIAWVRARHERALVAEVEAALPAPEDAERLARVLARLPDGESLVATATASVVVFDAYRMLLDGGAVDATAAGTDALPEAAASQAEALPAAVGEALGAAPGDWAHGFDADAGEGLAAFTEAGADPEQATDLAELSGIAGDGASEALADGLLYLPVATLVLATARAVERRRAGVPSDRVLAHFREEVVCRGAGVVGGSATLALAGGVLGGPLGAAAGYVLGAFAGSLGGRALGERRKQARLVRYLGAHRDALHDLGTELAEDEAVFDAFHAGIQGEVDRLGDHLAANESALRRHLTLWRRWWPDATTVRLRLAVQEASTQLVRIRGPYDQLAQHLDVLRHEDPVRLGSLVWQHPRLRVLGRIPAPLLAPVEDSAHEVRTEIAALEGRPPPPRGLEEPAEGVIVPFPTAASA